MKKMTREDIDQRLSKLRESNMNEDSYTLTRPACTMCYSISTSFYTITRKCDICGNDFEMAHSYPSDDDATVLGYEDILAKFSALGLDASLACRCKECVLGHKVIPYEIRVKAEGEAKYHVSYPKGLWSYGGNFRTVSIFELSLVMKFLSVPLEAAPLESFFDHLYNVEFREEESNFFEDKPLLDFSAEKELTFVKAINMIKEHIGYVDEDYDMFLGYRNHNNYIYERFSHLLAMRYSNITYKGINGEDIMLDFENSGFIKTQIDTALAKVLGLVITYSKEEVIKNVELIYSQNNEMKRHKSTVLQWVEERWHEPFTVFDYSDFMKKAKKELESDI